MANPTIAEIFDLYFEDAAAREIASMKSIKSHAKHLLAHFGDMAIDTFNTGAKQRMLRYASHRRDLDGVGDSTINREVRNLKAALNCAEREEIIDRGQNKWLPKPKANAPRDRVLSHTEGGELDRVVAAFADPRTPAHLALFVRIALFTGQRKSAILQLRREHIDFERGVIWFSKTQKKKTKKKRQDQPIHADLLPFLDAAVAAMAPECDYLVQWRGKAVKDVRSAYLSLLARAGITERCVIHDLRRTVAQTVRDETDDLGLAARLIGDTESTTGSTYARPKVSANLTAMNVMAAKLARASAVILPASPVPAAA